MRNLLVILAFLVGSIQVLGQPLLDLDTVQKVAAVNSVAEESLPLMSPDGRLYFVRSLFEENVGGQRAGQDIWYSSKSGDGWTAASNSLGKLNTIFNNGVVGIADSGRTLYLNGSYSNKLEYQTGLSVTHFKNGKWTKPKRLKMKGFNPRNDYYTYYLDDNMGVLFMSFTKAGSSNEDLYVSVKNGNKWSRPEHLGDAINTEESDFSPYLSEDGRTLYFSSYGHGSRGQADIYMSRRLSDSWLNWETPVNLGEPINSTGFDAYYSLVGDKAYFSSNREGKFSDLYMASYTPIIQEQLASGGNDLSESSSGISQFNGQVYATNLDVLTAIEIHDEEGNVVETITANENGEFKLSNLESYKTYFLDLIVGDSTIDQPVVYVINADGERVFLNRDLISGKFPFETLERDVRAIVVADVVDNTELNQTHFQIESADHISQDIVVELLDQDNNKLEETSVDGSGGFDLGSIQVERLYRLASLEEKIPEDSRLYITINGEKKEVDGNILRGMLFRKLSNGSLVLHHSGEMADKTVFGFDYGELDAEGHRVALLDEDGNILQIVETDENGMFAFSKLDPDANYSIRSLDEGDQGLAMFMLDAEGNKRKLSKLISDGGVFNGVIASDTELSVDEEMFYFDFAELPPAGSKVYLMDENDNVVDSSYVDAEGGFRFKKLSGSNQRIMLADVEDMSGDLSRFIVIDATGEEIAMDETGMTEKSVIGEEEAAATEEFSFDFNNLPPDGSMIYLKDENNNIIDSALVDADGEFRFTKLKPEGNYKMQLANAEDMSGDLSSFMIFDAEGNEIGLDETGETVSEVVGEEAATTEEYSFDFSDLPPEGSKVYIRDENDQIIDSAIVDGDGEFRFTKLNPDKQYLVQLETPDGTEFNMSLFKLKNKRGEEFAVTYEALERQNAHFNALSEEDRTRFYDQFEFDFAHLPNAGSMIYLLDVFGNVLDSTMIDSTGKFHFDKLERERSYLLVVGDDDFDLNKGVLYAFANGMYRELPVLENGFSFYPLQDVDMTESEFDVDRFLVITDDPIADDAQAYLFEENAKESVQVDSADIEKDGSFKFDKLDKDKSYSMKFDDSMDDEDMKLFSLSQDEVNEIDQAEEGFGFSGDDLAVVKMPVVNAPSDRFEEDELGDWVFYFEFNSYFLNSDQIKQIEKEIAPRLAKSPAASIEIEGHADNIGAEDVNLRMSLLRISNVMYHLEMNGLETDEMQKYPKGEKSPAASNETEEGRAKNRRVEISIVK